MRPTGWDVLDLDSDPTPGDPWQIRSLVRSATAMAEDAAKAHSAVRSLASDGAVLAWVGLAGEVFQGAIDDFPVQLGKLRDSYDQAADALDLWASQLDGVQGTADRALEQGRQAQAEIDALSAQLATARSAASNAAAASDRLDDQPEGGQPPTPDQLRAATRNLQAAQGQVGALTSSLSGAQSQLDAAKRMARQARELRISTARTVKHKLHDASDAGIAPKSRWEKFKEGAAKAWDITIKIATVVAIVVAVVALFVGGPLVWGLLAAASAVLLADSLAKYARGEGSLWEIGLNMLGVIPGGRLLGAAGKLIGRGASGARGLAAGGRALTTGRNAISSMTTTIRNGLAQRRAVLGGDAGSASIDMLTFGLTRIARGGTYARPSGYRAGVRNKVWDDAVEPATGRVRDPQTGQFMTPEKPWDMGHRPGYEARKHEGSAHERGISREQYLDEHNNSEIYRPELPSSNRNHAGEDHSADYFGP